MIRRFKDQVLEKLFQHGKAKGVPKNTARNITKELDRLEASTCIEDLEFPDEKRVKMSRKEGAISFTLSIGGGISLIGKWKDDSVEWIRMARHKDKKDGN